MGSKAKSQGPTAAEIAQSKQALSRMKEWETDGYKALENEQVARADNDYTGALSRVGSADVNQQAGGTSGLDATQGNLAYAIGDRQRAVATSLDGAHHGATTQAQTMQDQARIGMAKVGQNVALSTARGFGQVANTSAYAARQKLNSQNIRDMGRINALANAVGGAMAGYELGKPGAVTMQNAQPGQTSTGKPNASPALDTSRGWALPPGQAYS